MGFSFQIKKNQIWLRYLQLINIFSTIPKKQKHIFNQYFPYSLKQKHAVMVFATN